jgi:ribose transport system permease protein
MERRTRSSVDVSASEQVGTRQAPAEPPGTPPAEPSLARARRLSAQHRDRVARYAVLVAFLLTFATFAILRTDTFLNGDNLRDVLVQSSPLAVVALGLTVALVMRDFDLSIGAMMGLGGAVAIVAMSKNGIDWRVAVLLAIGAGVAAGAVNGLLIAYAGASSFVITLAIGTVLTGIEFSLTGQETVFENVAQGYVDIGQGEVAGINHQILVAFVVFVVVYLLLEKTEIGRYMRAIGGNPEAAHLAGIPVRRLRAIGFVVVAVLAAVAGVLVTAQASSSSPNAGLPFLLPAFAAVFLGSASFRPGQFNVLGTLVGVLFLGVIQNGLTLLELSTAVINIVQGSILALAVVFSGLAQRK